MFVLGADTNVGTGTVEAAETDDLDDRFNPTFIKVEARLKLE